MRARPVRTGTLVAVFWVVQGIAVAEPADFGGIALEPPEGWLLEDSERVRREIEVSAGIEDAAALVAVWREPRAERCGRIVLANHSASLRPGHLTPRRVRALLEAWARRRPMDRVLRIDDVRKSEVGGVAAQRVRLRRGGREGDLDQVLYLLCGRETYVLGLSIAPERLGELLPVFERVLGTVTVERQPPGYLASFWLWGGLATGLLAGEVRRRRRRLSRSVDLV